jgi:hypothetical protein
VTSPPNLIVNNFEIIDAPYDRYEQDLQRHINAIYEMYRQQADRETAALRQQLLESRATKTPTLIIRTRQ